MDKTKLGLSAVGFSCIAFLFIFLAFISSSWLVNDGEIEETKLKFENLGLWFVCFKNFEDPRHWYDTKFKECLLVYEEEYYIIYKFLLPGFYVAVQFFFTICFILTLIGCFLTSAYLCANKEADNFVCLLAVLGGDLFVAAFCGAISVILFGANGDARYWMPDWEHNNMGWSYWMAVIGTVALFVGGICFGVESRKHATKHKKFRQTSLDYVMSESERPTYN